MPTDRVVPTKLGPFYVLLAAVSLVASCDQATTAPKPPTAARHDIVCRSGYVVTSGDKCPDSTQG